MIDLDDCVIVIFVLWHGVPPLPSLSPKMIGPSAERAHRIRYVQANLAAARHLE
jgi:hypothetical protein